MSDTPLYSRELKKLRGDIGIVEFARKCGVSRESIRLVENGKLLPSKDLLFRWLDSTDTDPLFRVDILKDVIRRKVDKSSLASEVEELKQMAYPSSSTDMAGLIDELTDVFMEVGSLKPSMREGQYMRIRRIFDRHMSENDNNDE